MGCDQYAEASLGRIPAYPSLGKDEAIPRFHIYG
jgi:hypothetical protein